MTLENLTKGRRRTAVVAKPRIMQPADLPRASDPSIFPDVYSMILDGDCMQPLIPDRAAVFLQKSATFGAGDLVCVWFQPAVVKPGMHDCWLKRLTLNLPQWVKFPYKDHPQSDVKAIAAFEQLHPPRGYALACEHILTIHRAIGFVPPGMFGKTVNIDRMVKLPGTKAR